MLPLTGSFHDEWSDALTIEGVTRCEIKEVPSIRQCHDSLGDLA